jgi:hypothetical protein
VSRDDAREIAVWALLGVVGLRVAAGLVQVLQELAVPWTVRSLVTRFFSPIDTVVGLATLGAVLVVVLSPSGSITEGTKRLCLRVAGAVFVMGLLGTFVTLSLSLAASSLARVLFALYNGLGAALLGGCGWWIIRNFDPDR